jgi:hypothetical protein
MLPVIPKLCCHSSCLIQCAARPEWFWPTRSDPLLAQPLWGVRLRSAGRNQLFDAPFRLAASLAHDSLVVLLGQVMRQQKQAREMDGSRAPPPEERPPLRMQKVGPSSGVYLLQPQLWLSRIRSGQLGSDLEIGRLDLNINRHPWSLLFARHLARGARGAGAGPCSLQLAVTVASPTAIPDQCLPDRRPANSDQRLPEHLPRPPANTDQRLPQLPSPTRASDERTRSLVTRLARGRSLASSCRIACIAQPRTRAIAHARSQST